MGGEIMFVEATQMDGEGRMTLTGQLGDVMKESAELAMNWVRSHARRVGSGGIIQCNQASKLKNS
jgi:ATP-dependent Lon protease